MLMSRGFLVPSMLVAGLLATSALAAFVVAPSAPLPLSLIGFQLARFSKGHIVSWVAKAADILTFVSMAVDLFTVAFRDYGE